MYPISDPFEPNPIQGSVGPKPMIGPYRGRWGPKCDVEGTLLRLPALQNGPHVPLYPSTPSGFSVGAGGPPLWDGMPARVAPGGSTLAWWGSYLACWGWCLSDGMPCPPEWHRWVSQENSGIRFAESLSDPVTGSPPHFPTPWKLGSYLGMGHRLNCAFGGHGGPSGNVCPIRVRLRNGLSLGCAP